MLQDELCDPEAGAPAQVLQKAEHLLPYELEMWVLDSQVTLTSTTDYLDDNIE